MELIWQHTPSFLLILCRMSAFFVVAPVFSFQGVPNQFKVGIAFFVSLAVYINMDIMPGEIELDGDYLLSVVREVLIGLIIGYVAYLFFTVVQVAGSFVDLQMGFGVVNVIDPITGAQSPILGNFKFFVAILLFLALNGHHYLLVALMESYQWVPLSSDLFVHIYAGNVSNFIVESITAMFIIAFKIAAPLIAALFLTDVALGMLARTAPQFNVFVVGIPLKIIIGFLIFFLMISGFMVLFQQLFETLLESIYALFELLE